MKSFLARIAIVCLFAAGVMALNAQSQQAAQAERQAAAAAQAAQNDMPQQQQDSKPFSGTIVKEKGKLVLKDDASNTSYQLDDQEKAKPFEGKQVKVTGKLDVQAKLIHVDNIEAGS
jgi:type II secretory pathway pseudopilin PulG